MNPITKPFPSADDQSGQLIQPLMSVRTAREAAFTAVEEHLTTGVWVTDVLDRLYRSPSLPSIERGLATELACGTVRRFATLDTILGKLVARPLEKVEPALLTILRLGVYQLIVLDSIPHHAAVHETVELTKRLGQMRWSGFVNGVLRGATRLVTESFAEGPSSRAVPVSGGRHRLLNEAVFSDPARDLIGYFSAAYSVPDWLADRWASRMDAAALVRLGDWFNTPAELHLRVNGLRTDVASFLAELQNAEVSARPVDATNIILVSNAGPIDKLPGYEAGWFAVQDLSASRAAIRLAPKPQSRVWDVCAAPGGKTCHLAELMQNQGEVLATDIRHDRLSLVDQSKRRLGADIVRTCLIKEDGSDLPDGPFDAILVDVPCSNTGVMGKRPEARWRISPAGITELKKTQERLLMSALERLAPNGRVVYSTCSIEPEENGELVRRVLSRVPEARLVNEELFLPGQPTDGGYQALITR